MAKNDRIMQALSPSLYPQDHLQTAHIGKLSQYFHLICTTSRNPVFHGISEMRLPTNIPLVIKQKVLRSNPGILLHYHLQIQIYLMKSSLRSEI
jgi:hypothetical protein